MPIISARWSAVRFISRCARSASARRCRAARAAADQRHTPSIKAAEMGSNVRVLLRRQPAVPIRTPCSGRGVDPMGLEGSRRPSESSPSPANAG